MHIFISYRRDDSQDATGRLADRLGEVFGQENIFVDVVSTDLGLDFRRIVEQEVARCDVMLAIIGPGWLHARDSEGARRLDNPKDLVRSEIAAGLTRGIPVIPVLMNGALLP